MTWDSVATVLSAICLITGAALSLAAAIGLMRFPDVHARMHASTKPQVLGVLLMLAGLALRLSSPADLTMIVLVGVFQMMTAPVSAQMIGRAAFRSGAYRPETLVVNELAGEDGTDDAPAAGPSAGSGTAGPAAVSAHSQPVSIKYGA